MNREVITRLLKKQGYETVCVENGKEAVDIIKNSDSDKYQLILMDVRMPVMDGISATKKIRALKNLEKASIPIIAMTADAFVEDRDKCIDVGMNEYLSKPVEPQKLYNVLKECIRKNKLQTNGLYNSNK